MKDREQIVHEHGVSAYCGYEDFRDKLLAAMDEYADTYCKEFIYSVTNLTILGESNLKQLYENWKIASASKV